MSILRAHVYLAMVISGIVASALNAQEPTGPPARSLATDAAPTVGCEENLPSIFSMNLMLGMQTGIRGQLALFRQENRSFAIEAFYGGIMTRGMGSSEGAGVGGRMLFQRCSRNGCNALVLGPGVDLLGQFNNDHLLMVAPTLDLSWVHGFENGAGWESGLSVGVGVGVSSSKESDENIGKVTPLISFFTWLRY